MPNLEHPNCICGEPAIWAFQLLTRKIFRCEEHRKKLESPVYKQFRIPPEGIELTDQDRFNIIDSYIYHDKPVYGLEELKNETRYCDFCKEIIKLSKEEKIKSKFEINEHYKKHHPKNYSQFIKIDGIGIEHSIILEHPEDFFSLFQQKPDHLIAIPIDLLGEDEISLNSDNFIDLTMLEISNNVSKELLSSDNYEDGINYWIQSIRERSLTEIQTMDLMDKMSLEVKMKIKFMTELFGEESEYVKYLKGFEEISKVQENCPDCMKIYKNRHDIPEEEMKAQLMNHFETSHKEHFDKVRKITHEKNLEEKYPEDVRYKVGELLNDCKTCLQIIDNEFIPDDKVQEDLQAHIIKDHKEVLRYIDPKDIIIQPKFEGGKVSRVLKTTTKSDENKLKIGRGLKIDVDEITRIVDGLTLKKYSKENAVKILSNFMYNLAFGTADHVTGVITPKHIMKEIRKIEKMFGRDVNDDAVLDVLRKETKQMKKHNKRMKTIHSVADIGAEMAFNGAKKKFGLKKIKDMEVETQEIDKKIIKQYDLTKQEQKLVKDLIPEKLGKLIKKNFSKSMETGKESEISHEKLFKQEYQKIIDTTSDPDEVKLKIDNLSRQFFKSIPSEKEVNQMLENVKTKDRDKLPEFLSMQIINEFITNIPALQKEWSEEQVSKKLKEIGQRKLSEIEDLTEEEIFKTFELVKEEIRNVTQEVEDYEKPKPKLNGFKDKRGKFHPISQSKPTLPKEYKPRKEFVKYEEFKKFLKEKGITSIREFIKFVELNEVPDNIPQTSTSAEFYYRKQGVWKGWSSACGKERKEAMTRERIDEILDHILENFNAFMSLSDALLLFWFDSFGLFGTKDPLKNVFFKNFIEWRDKEHGKDALYKWLTDRDFENDHYGYTLVQKKDETREQFLSRQYASSAPKKEQLFRTTTESIDDILHQSRSFDPVDYKKNPKLFNIFVDFVVDRLMMSYIDNPNQQFNFKKNRQRFNDTVIDRFKDMKKIVKQLDYKQRDYRGQEPTLLQKYGVYRARKKLGFLNMFGTGSGKTKIGFMLAKHISAKRVFWVSPYNVVNQTNEMCSNDYPDSILTSVLDKKTDKKIPDSFIRGDTSARKTRFHFINYERFNNKTNGKRLIEQLHDTKIDLLVLDEGQRVKSRRDESNTNERTTKSSNTRQNVLELVRKLRKKNPKMKVLILTATPIINNIREAMSIYEILTSSILNMSGTNNIKNGMRMYVELLPYSVRFEQKYDIDIIQTPVVCEGFLPDSMSEDTAQSLSWLDIEQISTKYRIPEMIKEAKEIMKKDAKSKILIYTDLKTGIVDQLVEAFSEHKEFKVGLFHGDDKTGMVLDMGEIDGKRKFFNPFVKGDVNVLIATRSIAVGIDGIQTICNHIFFNGLVWTWADFEQIRGRLVRTGQKKDKVYVHMFFATLNGYPYDLNLKYKRILRKKGLGELVRDGRLPKDIETGITKREKKEFIKTCFKNRISGFPTKEELELKHSQVAQKQIESEVEEIQEKFPEIDLGGSNDEQ